MWKNSIKLESQVLVIPFTYVTLLSLVFYSVLGRMDLLNFISTWVSCSMLSIFTQDIQNTHWRKQLQWWKKLILSSKSVSEFYSINTQLQGPQRCVSSVFSDNVQTLLYTLQSLLKDYPNLKDKINTQAISTKPNESLHSLCRGRTLTPDAYELGEFPKFPNYLN